MRALPLLLLACADGAGKPSAADDSGEAPVWPPDPSTYDCSASTPPARWIDRPAGCATDPTCTETLVSGHRGAGGALGVIAPEDTVHSVYAAVAYGLDFVETDPRPTADGALVNLHDDTVDRTTSGTGDVATMTLTEVQSLQVDLVDFPGDWSCAYIPTLDEILLAARGRIDVLVDANKTDRVDLLVEAILRTDMVEHALFDTSSVEKIDAALLIEPSLRTMIRVDSEAQLTEQLAHFASHPPVIVEINDNAPELAEVVRSLGHRPLMDVFLADASAGLTGDTTMYEAALSAGVMIPQTDRPDLLLPLVWGDDQPARRSD
jgi:glycerophosphoryl diester phosphodiesterase